MSARESGSWRRAGFSQAFPEGQDARNKFWVYCPKPITLTEPVISSVYCERLKTFLHFSLEHLYIGLEQKLALEDGDITFCDCSVQKGGH